VLLGFTTPFVGLLYFFSQLLAAVSSLALLHAIFPAQTLVKYNHFATTLNYAEGINPFQGIVLEAITTFTLITTILLVGVHKRSPRKENLTPVIVGIVILAIILMGANLTGASLNPVRSFGPALLGNVWDAHYVYWIGPFLGAIFATLCCKFLVGLE